MVYHRGLLEMLYEDQQFKNMLEGLERGLKSQVVYGLVSSQKSFWIGAIALAAKEPLLVIAPDAETARGLAAELAIFLPERVDYFPPREMLPYQVFAHSNEIQARRLNVMAKILNGSLTCLVTTGEAILQQLIPKQVLAGSFFSLKQGDVVQWELLLDKISRLGFERVDLVEAPGQFSVRGGLIDLYLLTEVSPVRIEFFDDEIDSIRYFDLESQRSIAEIESITLTPARELLLTSEAKALGQQLIEKEWAVTRKRLEKLQKKEAVDNLDAKISGDLEKLAQDLWTESLERFQPFFYPEQQSISDYFRRKPLIIVDEINRVMESMERAELERAESFADLTEAGAVLPSQAKIYAAVSSFPEIVGKFQACYFSALPQKLSGVQPQNILSVNTKTMHPFMSKFNLLAEEVELWKKNKYKIVFMVSNQERAKFLQGLLSDHRIEAAVIPGLDKRPGPGVTITVGALLQGFEYPDLKLVLVTEQEVFGQRKRKKPRQAFKEGSKIGVFSDLKVGDYVVHVHHGIGRYLGIEQLEVGGVYKDYLLIQYSGEDKLYIPTDQVELIQKYIGAEGHVPKLNKLGGNEWNKVKSRVKASVQDMAKELLQLYAAREASVGFAFSPDTVWQKEFEEAFPYTETPDQLQAIIDVKKDMEKPKPMDRLLVGDVGYGKTEVALRAAFKATMDSKQVAVLVPTTVLAQQHYNTFSQRFSNYPIKIGLLNRFKSPKEQQAVLQGLKDGSIDVVIGTHRLLSSDVKFKDLGLVIVDEEQRFGVAHKERLKQIRESVDVLTLTATPIPRTLHMSLAGTRDMSIIETPPEERYPVQTYVVEYSPELIRDAIRRELNRGGQVYFIHNRIADLDRVASFLQQLVPNARIAIAHGQMKEDELEEAMLGFIEGEYDVLLCTTIVENGLDISNVNTLIVDEADHLGLAQLYQLRGRVGRSNRLAYAYFTYRPDKVLNPVAEKRLRAIREFTEFGSGFKIAMRDLEIRGAGNLLGPEQHGHMLAVGFDLYCRLLEEAVAQLKGATKARTEVQPVLDIDVNAYISDAYIGNSGIKMEFYQRLGEAGSEEEVQEIIDELIDRFGDPPQPVVNLAQIAVLRTLAKQTGAKAIKAKKNEAKLEFRESPLGGEKLLELDREFRRRLTFAVSEGLTITVKISPREHENLLNLLVSIFRKIKSLA
ncbi:transcription-repair coupling factor [Zhaonella formicivorans]|uniref:transcription-repair coupling factor n=1 Tax=Zhaonella formicivorans TaxID=2528593 RepID=UPI0010D1FCE1|nr:transcription-repair coupling factor [Zhaonella formicivorans]